MELPVFLNKIDLSCLVFVIKHQFTTKVISGHYTESEKCPNKKSNSVQDVTRFKSKYSQLIPVIPVIIHADEVQYKRKGREQ